MENYELLYILPAKYTDDEILPIQESVRDQITKVGGKIFFEDNLGKKRLAYPIQKMTQGYYLLSEFGLEPENLSSLNKNLKLSEQVLRHLIVKKKARSEKEIEHATRKFVAAPAPTEQRREFSTESLLKPDKKEEKPDIKDEKKDKEKMDDLDKKLDEILDTDII